MTETTSTPQYSNGDRITIPARRVEGKVVSRWYDEMSEGWIYRIHRENDRLGVYQEKNLSQ